MTTKLLLASLVTLSCAAADAQRAPTPPAPPTTTQPAACRATGRVLFEARTTPRDGVETKAMPLSDTTLYASGAWTYRETLDGTKPAKTISGCLSADQMKTIREDLRTSSWTITHNDITCMAMSATETHYLVNGKDVFTAMLCGHDSLDTESQKHLTEIEKILADAREPKTPPCCKK